MPYARRNRGSVLLMAIGLLTILAIMASTFLVVSNLDAEEAEVLATKAQADPAAEGALANVLARLAQDRHPDGNMAYLGMDDGPTGWDQFVDAPQDQDDADDERDPWLAANYDPQDNTWRSYRSAVLDDTGNAADTDGDANNDAYMVKLFPDINDPNVEAGKFRVAVRVVDLGGKVCVNTAGHDFPPSDNARPTTRGPLLVDLRGMIGTQAYDDVHMARCNNRSVSLEIYDAQCGRRLLSPMTNYEPFGIGDELFLLWGAPMQESPVTRVGRLYDVLGPHLETWNTSGYLRGDKLRRQLTTFNCSDAALRHPALGRFQLQYLDVTTRQGREDIYEQMAYMLDELGIGPDAERTEMAAHFTANLWAYLSADEADWPWPFQAVAGGPEVFGVKEELVLTEAHAKHKAKSEDDKDDWEWGAAVEVLNPTSRAVNMSAEGYKLRVNGSTIALGGTIPAATGSTVGRAVYYSYDHGADANADPGAFFGGGAINSWNRVEGLSFLPDGAKVQLVRERQATDPVAGGQRLFSVPLDEVAVGESGLTYKSPGPDPAGWTKDQSGAATVARDDRVVEGGTPMTRFRLGYWTEQADGPTLGQANGRIDPVEPNDNAKYPIPMLEADRLDPTDVQQQRKILESIGDLANIYLTGPISTDGGKAFPQRIIRYQQSGVFADSATRGRLPLLPEGDEPNVSVWGAYQPDRYPDVPPGCFYGEFFTNIARHVRRGEPGRIYGLVNINTATREVLMALPWPAYVDNVDSARADYAIDANEVVGRIIAYRRGGGARDAVDDLRDHAESDFEGFTTPGELGVVLGEYMRTVIPDTDRKHPNYVRARDALYRAVADCIATRSNVFAVYITVQYGAVGRYKWHYMAVVDRTNVTEPPDTASVLMFAEVK